MKRIISLVTACLFLPTAIATAEEKPRHFVFRDVAAEMGLAEPLKGMMAHAAAWGDRFRADKQRATCYLPIVSFAPRLRKCSTPMSPVRFRSA